MNCSIMAQYQTLPAFSTAFLQIIENKGHIYRTNIPAHAAQLRDLCIISTSSPGRLLLYCIGYSFLLLLLHARQYFYITGTCTCM